MTLKDQGNVFSGRSGVETEIFDGIVVPLVGVKPIETLEASLDFDCHTELNFASLL